MIMASTTSSLLYLFLYLLRNQNHRSEVLSSSSLISRKQTCIRYKSSSYRSMYLMTAIDYLQLQSIYVVI